MQSIFASSAMRLLFHLVQEEIKRSFVAGSEEPWVLLARRLRARWGGVVAVCAGAAMVATGITTAGRPMRTASDRAVMAGVASASGSHATSAAPQQANGTPLWADGEDSFDGRDAERGGGVSDDRFEASRTLLRGVLMLTLGLTVTRSAGERPGYGAGTTNKPTWRDSRRVRSGGRRERQCKRKRGDQVWSTVVSWRLERNVLQRLNATKGAGWYAAVPHASPSKRHPVVTSACPPAERTHPPGRPVASGSCGVAIASASPSAHVPAPHPCALLLQIPP